MKKLIILPLFLLLAGCATLSGNQEQIIMNKCPILKKYTPEQLERAASELGTLPDESQLSLMLSDYSKLRDACRVVEKKLKKRRRNG